MMLRVTFRGMAKLEGVGVVVTDLERAVKFYRVLGVPFPDGAEKSEHGHADVTLEGGMRFLVDTEETMRSFDPGWKRGTGSPPASLAFGCESPSAVDEVFAKAISAGGQVHKEPWDAFWGQRYAQLRDPDGNAIDLYAALPK